MIPKEIISKAHLKQASVYLQADNVAFWTPYDTPSDRNDYRNLSNPYPTPLVLSLGLNVNF